jgi:hypothetical protein
VSNGPMSSPGATTQAPQSGSSANHIRIDMGAPTLAIIVVLTALIGACGVVMGLNLSEQAALEREFARETARQVDSMTELKRQYRMTELKLDDWNVVAHRAGLALSGDYTRGPQGNLDSESFKQSKGK